MKKISGFFLLTLTLMLPLPAAAQLNVNISVSLPPPIVVAEPPRLVVLPETYVYVAPELDIDIFFSDGWWWRSWNRHWYRSRHYSSGWQYYEDEPDFYRQVPREWRRWYGEHRWREYTWEHRPLTYHEVERNWQDWEDTRYWEKETYWYLRDGRSSTEVRMEVSVPPPPPIRFTRAPELVVIPETYVYVVPDAHFDIFFYDGWWWRTWEGRWYRSHSHSSGWLYYNNTPVFYRDIPLEWRQYYRDSRWREYYWDHRPLPYHQVEQNWRNWKDVRYWEKQKRWDMRRMTPKPPPQQRQVAPPPYYYDNGGRSKHDKYPKGNPHPNKGNPHKDKGNKHH